MDDNSPPVQAFPIPRVLPFRAVLTPHRSLPPHGFLLLMTLLGGVSFVTGVAFAMNGAWPVMGFFGLDVGLVYVAFKLNYRSGTSTETIEITGDELIVTREAPNGRRSVARLNPTWARLETREAPDGSVDLRLVLHDRQIRVARDLGSDKRREVAVVLRAALRLVRQAEWS
jgi:uncharacterized membrane protein